MMSEFNVINEHTKRGRRTVQLAVALALFVVLVYALTFSRLPVWLPALQ
jgi:hypothetical protein